MANAMASMAGLRGSSQAVLEGSLQLSGSSRLDGAAARKVSLATPGFSVKAHLQPETEITSRRAAVGLVAAGIASGSFVQAVLAIEAKSTKTGPPPPPSVQPKPIKIGPPPLPSGGLPGTLNSDQPRDLDLPLNERFYIQPLPPAQAAVRAKESAKDIVNVKSFIDKKAWPYVQMDLRLKASLLRYDLNTIISAKPSKEEKKSLKDLTGKLFTTISNLDHAAKIKSSPEAEKYYVETVSKLNDVLSKIG